MIKSLLFFAVILILSSLSGCSTNNKIRAGVTPHHLLAEEIITDFFKKIGASYPEIIVVVSPDHFGFSRQSFSTNLPVDAGLGAFLSRETTAEEFGSDPSMFVREHGINNLIPFIRKFSPRSEIFPLTVSRITREDRVKKIAETLAGYEAEYEKDMIVIASADFSHYVTSSVAEKNDSKSAEIIKAPHFDSFKKMRVDCWQCVYLAAYFAKINRAAGVELLARSDSNKILGIDNPSSEVTSYISLLFR